MNSRTLAVLAILISSPYVWTMALATLATAQNACAQFDDSAFKQAVKVKKGAYNSDLTVSGGDRATSSFRVTQVRSAANPAGYDRMVIDLQNGEGTDSPTVGAVIRPPFYMVENDPSNKRILVTLYGRAKLDFSHQSSTQQAKKTKHISKLDFLPVVDDDRWTFVIHTQVPVKTEVFELSSPARIIIDLKP